MAGQPTRRRTPLTRARALARYRLQNRVFLLR